MENVRAAGGACTAGMGQGSGLLPAMPGLEAAVLLQVVVNDVESGNLLWFGDCSFGLVAELPVGQAATERLGWDPRVCCTENTVFMGYGAKGLNNAVRRHCWVLLVQDAQLLGMENVRAAGEACSWHGAGQRCVACHSWFGGGSLLAWCEEARHATVHFGGFMPWLGDWSMGDVYRQCCDVCCPLATTAVVQLPLCFPYSLLPAFPSLSHQFGVI
mmetsp:Transcript_33384/g.78051  ORF Transcript_33384/g.78051 Transcript_33384/m.78051 type:complete len:215 (-) Transcript_33384:109-753(-)